MITLNSLLPSEHLSSVIERYFITSNILPDGQTWENKSLPSIMQSIVIDFDSTPPRAKFPNGRQISCPGDLIFGQYTRSWHSLLEGKLDFIGVHFTPTGLYRILGTDMSKFSNDILPLPDYINWHSPFRQKIRLAQTTEERIAVIEQFISENLLPAPIYMDVISMVANLIRNSNGTTTMEYLCKESGMSERSLQRYFKAYIGVSPKAFSQIARFNAVTKLIESTPALSWQEILDATGYFDAAHFANDFKRITGKTPSEYYKGKTYYEKFFYA